MILVVPVNFPKLVAVIVPEFILVRLPEKIPVLVLVKSMLLPVPSLEMLISLKDPALVASILPDPLLVRVLFSKVPVLIKSMLLSAPSLEMLISLKDPALVASILPDPSLVRVLFSKIPIFLLVNSIRPALLLLIRASREFSLIILMRAFLSSPLFVITESASIIPLLSKVIFPSPWLTILPLMSFLFCKMISPDLVFSIKLETPISLLLVILILPPPLLMMWLINVPLLAMLMLYLSTDISSPELMMSPVI
ncbi:hypothetical protein SALWKB12_0448 [Snodgrassella communis]|nr:hypothetical protein SALWKB12_0448 [Snodgrassella communis]